MTSTTEGVVSDVAPLAGSAGPSPRVRFAVAFIVGLVAALAAGAGAIYAYGAGYNDRVLPGVHVGSVDVSGLDSAAAASRLAAAYASLGQGSIVLATPKGDLTLGFDEIGRRPDVDAMVSAAMAVGRSGSPLERAIAEARTALDGVAVEPRVALDADRLSTRVSALVAPLQRRAANAAVAISKTGFELIEARTGASIDAPALARSLVTTLGSPNAGSTVRVDVPVAAIAPTIDDADATAGKAAAEKMVADVTLVAGKEHWTIAANTVRSWLRFSVTADGRYMPTIDDAMIGSALKSVAKKANEAPKNATYLVGKGSAIVGVTAGKDGRSLDVTATSALITQALNARAAGAAGAPVELAFTAVKPAFGTEQAKATAPLMKKISTWTTYFPITVNNGFGANIWLPAEFIDGTVVAPGATFDFWKAVGPVTRERGFKQGGAIIDGHTEPQGALAGGICSCSTTLFNAALRAGFEMKARKNHFYYIDRYPLGLDATVFISASGATQTMSWVNDTKYPVLIRGYRIRKGSSGYVKFDLYSVPTGRKVVISKPVVKNVRPASDSVQYTSALAAGTQKRVEYPVDGKDVWRSVTVYENGKVIHQYTYYSHYSRITGIIQIGTRGATTPSPSPSPAP